MYSKILLAVDMNEEASWKKALPTALALCRTFDASLHVVTVLPDYHMPLVGSYFPEGFAQQARQAITEAQHAFVKKHVPEEVAVQCIVAEGSPWEAIVKTSRKLHVDLIVMASHTKRKFADYILGPNAEHVVHHAKMSVMIVR